MTAAVHAAPRPAVDALVAAARAGDPAALERLLVVARPQLARYARQHCAADDVEEAVQDALWILYRRLRGLRRAAAFAAWLFQVVRRACLRYARARRPDVPLDGLGGRAEFGGPEGLGGRGAPAAPAGDPDLRIALRDAIAALPPHYREVLLLKDVQGLSADEVAAVVGLSAEGAKSRLHRARAQVRAALTDGPAPARGPA